MKTNTLPDSGLRVKPPTVFDSPSPTDRVVIPVAHPHSAYFMYAEHYKQFFGNTNGLIDKLTFVSRINSGRTLAIGNTEYKKP